MGDHQKLPSFPPRPPADLARGRAVGKPSPANSAYASSTISVEPPSSAAELSAWSSAAVKSVPVGLWGLQTKANVSPSRRHRDRKSTRLKSSHANISYAVFC